MDSETESGERRVTSNRNADNRRCSRPLCGAVADVVLLFEYRVGHVVLDWTPAEHDPNYLELCLEHTESFHPPKGWTVEDRRTSVQSMVDNPSHPRHHAAVVVPN